MFAQQGLADDGELPAPGAGATGFDTGLQGAHQAVDALKALLLRGGCGFITFGSGCAQHDPVVA